MVGRGADSVNKYVPSRSLGESAGGEAERKSEILKVSLAHVDFLHGEHDPHGIWATIH